MPSTAITAIGQDHVRLSYLYLDNGDIEGFESLWDAGVPPRGGRTGDRHLIYKMVAADDCVAVMGRLVGPPDVDFADFFTLSDEGLLLGCRRYHFVDAPDAG
ncbi:hypothetical protein [Actinoplanes sp. NPDC051851]|uniref:hypothetical protein n=1 Tax=Actinoplanes sp. NPDC051851 TaxID=3154753 RepID=UPI003448A648